MLVGMAGKGRCRRRFRRPCPSISRICAIWRRACRSIPSARTSLVLPASACRSAPFACRTLVLPSACRPAMIRELVPARRDPIALAPSSECTPTMDTERVLMRWRHRFLRWHMPSAAAGRDMLIIHRDDVQEDERSLVVSAFEAEALVYSLLYFESDVPDELLRIARELDDPCLFGLAPGTRDDVEQAALRAFSAALADGTLVALVFESPGVAHLQRARSARAKRSERSAQEHVARRRPPPRESRPPRSDCTSTRSR